MSKKILYCFVAGLGALLLTATNGFSYGSFGDAVNDACQPAAMPYTNNNCALCHTSNRSAPTPATEAYNANQLVEFFCPPTTPTCTDDDGDGYALEGGDCGPVDCDDTDAAINPGAAENCRDAIDNNCNGLIDAADPAATGCLVCTDADGDNFAREGGECGPVDCDDTDAAINPDATDIPNNGIDENCSGGDSVDPTVLDNDGDGYNQTDDCDDTDATINPGATDIPGNGIDENCDGVDSIDPADLDNDGDGFTQVTGDCDDTDAEVNPNAIENCTDQIDNDCDGLVDTQDPDAVDCPVTCTDNDADTYAMEGGECGPIDCNDNDAFVNPGAEEICGDALDNDCDGSIDEGCEVTCQDLDADGYKDIQCGGNDCNDTDAAINPGSSEVCGNGVDENCNGESDDVCLTCPDGTLLVIKKVDYNRRSKTLLVKGRATAGTSVTLINTDTEEVLAENIQAERGRWAAEIQVDGNMPKNVTAITSNGCTTDKQIRIRHFRKNHFDRSDRLKDRRGHKKYFWKNER